MKIIVLNGSPKGELSVTMQYVKFLQKKFLHHELKIINVSQDIGKIEADKRVFQEIIDEIKLSDGVLWAFPVHYFLVPFQYKRFIELISEREAGDVFRDKYVAILTTSIHFFDHTAHNYMHALCDDLDMKYIGSFSADMDDLLKGGERKRLVLFAENFLETIENKLPTFKSFRPLVCERFEYVPDDEVNKIDISGKRVIIVTDAEENQINLMRMIERFKKSFSKEAEVINLNAINIEGGCKGCIHCGYDNACIYKDEYVEFYNSKIKTADILVFAGAIKDRYLSSKWKLFFDRSFFHNHVPSLIGKQIGFIISGPLSQLHNLREIFEGYAEWQQANLVDFVTDEWKTSAEIDALLERFTECLVRFTNKNYVKPHTFLGFAGMKVFRDHIWGRCRFPFRADHLFYKKHRLYDFPQKDFKTRIVNSILLLLTKIPIVRKEIYSKRINEETIKPLQKVLRDY